MDIAIKLGTVKEVERLLHSYDGPFRTFELPVTLLSEKTSLKELARRGFIFYVHGTTMYTEDLASQMIDRYCNYFQVCSELACDKFIFHGIIRKDSDAPSPDDQLIDITFNTLETINNHAIKLGIKCYLENGCYKRCPSNKYYEMPCEPASHLKLAQSLSMGIVLDLGHASLTAHSYEQTLEDFLIDYINAPVSPDVIHFSDNSLKSDDHLAIGDGKADINIFHKATKQWPDSLMTIENFPDNIYKSLLWLIEHEENGYSHSDIQELCGAMEWDFQK